jgi:hypothetical protein
MCATYCANHIPFDVPDNIRYSVGLYIVELVTVLLGYVTLTTSQTGQIKSLHLIAATDTHISSVLEDEDLLRYSALQSR